jgi:hypothetical protein
MQHSDTPWPKKVLKPFSTTTETPAPLLRLLTRGCYRMRTIYLNDDYEDALPVITCARTGRLIPVCSMKGWRSRPV